MKDGTITVFYNGEMVLAVTQCGDSQSRFVGKFGTRDGEWLRIEEGLGPHVDYIVIADDTGSVKK